MNKLIVPFISVLLILLSCLPLQAGNPTVVRVGAFDYYPGIFKDDDGIVKGFYVDALADLGRQENIRFEYIYGSWSEGLERIKSGEVDLLTSVAYTKERAKVVDYASMPLLTVWGELYVPQASDIDGIREVQGKKIAVMKGDFNARNFIDLVQKFDITCEFIELPGFDAVFKAIATKKVDAGVVNSTFGVAKMKEYHLRSSGVVFNPFDIYFAVAKGKNQELLNLLDHYLITWRHQADSPYNKARQKWSHGSTGLIKLIPRWLVTALVALILLALGSAAFIIMLRKQVRSKTSSAFESLKRYQLLQARQEAILSAVPDIIMEADTNKVYTWSNRAGSDFFGDDVVGKAYESYFAEGQNTAQIIRPLYDGTEESMYVESRQRRKDGDIRILAWWCKALTDEHGTVTGTLSTARDITEQKQTESSLHDANERLQQQYDQLQVIEGSLREQNDELLSAEERLRKQINEYKTSQDLLKESESALKRQNSLFSSLLKIIPIGVLMVEAPSGKPLVANEAALQLLGRGIIPDTSKTNVTTSYKIFKAGTSEPYPPDKMPIQLAMCGVTSHVDDLEVERPDGTKSLLEVFGAPLTDDNGNVWASLVSFIDITGRKQAEVEKDQLERQLQHAQKMESVGRLAGGVAHDFNNMLTVILCHAHLGLMRLEPANPVQADLQEIINTAERSAALTRQLLAFARKQTIAPRVLDLNEIISGMLRMLQRLIGENITLTWQPAEELWQTKVDPSQIDQILANLCVNASDAILDTGRITIGTSNSIIDAEYCQTNREATPGEYVHLCVSDDGFGMDRETLTHIYEPFYTTKDLGKGTGLGLATVYGAVKQNNGFINVYSKPGLGTTFSIYLPRDANINDSQKLADSATEAVLGGNETILLVEDELAILNIAAQMLEGQGYTVLSANSPGEAINLAREHAGKIRMLITDVVMPAMNGRDLANTILSLYPEIKCLFISGYTADFIAHHGVLDEGVHFIQKPFSLPSITTKVREVLDGAQ
ncbi:MAG: transporter substrate-binding domain-containing protein [Desulfuromonadaceae bacterium]|nr:transporter substrate-binding domain-containing protein [Desulfuromonadaceae bacterium]MDD2849329.1 transporter substrate-binding domain-containing protein [Desulfuromonadaceae bacterium]MDD4129388.1 transporter substrate-binding domain-containing protein [Desulfuromonadaceae bacterium]